jgi:lipoprotein-anchoring transpeptidase ErfK/SrfK
MLQFLKRCAELLCFTWIFWLYSSSKISIEPDLNMIADQPAIKVSTPSTPTPKKIATPTTEPTVAQVPRLEIRPSQRQATLYQGLTPIQQFPVAVGRQGWETPIGRFKVMQMKKNPTWINPMTGNAIPGGDPKNPMGSYWIGFWTDGKYWIGFHGTPKPETVGQAVSHGCVRMYNEDISTLYYQVALGTPVIVKP